MAHTETVPANLTSQQLHILAELYQVGQSSEIMDRTLSKLFAYEADICRRQLAQVQHDLAEFEVRFQLNSDEFYRQFQAGQTGDDLDLVEWAALVQMSDNLKKRLTLLAGAL